MKTRIFLQKGLDSQITDLPSLRFADRGLDVTAIISYPLLTPTQRVTCESGCNLFRPRRHADRSQAGHSPLDPVRAAPARPINDPDRRPTDLVHRPAAARQLCQAARWRGLCRSGGIALS